MPTPSQNHVSQPLTNFSLQVLQSLDSFIALKMFPKVPTNKESDLYYTYTVEDMMRDQAKLRAPNTEVALGDYGLSTGNFFCKEWGFGKDISEREARNADSILNPEQDATRFVTETLLIKRERNFIANFFGTGIWGTDLAGGADFTLWSDYTNGTPVTNVKTWRRRVQLATGRKPNRMMLTPDVWDMLSEHPQIIGRLAYNSPGFQAAGGRATTEQVAAMMELDQILVADAVYNTSAVPGAPSNAFIAGTKSLLLAHVTPNPSPRVASAGYHFVWTGADGVNEEGIAISVEDVPNKNTRERIEGAMFFDPKVVAPSLGLFASSVIA